jgi:hypothetical protein
MYELDENGDTLEQAVRRILRRENTSGVRLSLEQVREQLESGFSAAYLAGRTPRDYSHPVVCEYPGECCLPAIGGYKLCFQHYVPIAMMLMSV